MTTKAGHTKAVIRNQAQIFSDFPQMISTGGNILTNQQHDNDLAEAEMFSQTIYANTFNATSMGFRLTLGGEISSSGGGDITLDLNYGSTTILALLSVGLAAENDKTFRAIFEGHILTTGATGKVVAVGQLDVAQGTHLTFMADTANTGTTVDLTADGSMNVVADWDNASADDDLIITYGWLQLFN